MKTFWTILFILLGLGLLFALWYFFLSETAKKKRLVDKIMLKSGKDGHDILDPKKLMAMDLKTLQGIADGTVR